MAEPLSIGVDLGGTKIAFVLIDEQGNDLADYHLPTGVSDGPDAVIDRIGQGIQFLMERAKQPVAGIGIGSPGHLNPVTGIVHNAVNLAWRDVPLCTEVRRRLDVDLPIWLQKDTNAAVLGELFYGAGRGFKDIVLVAIGTGLGVGALVDGRLLMGATYYATDVGHLSLDPAGRLCSCGLRGCIEMYLSGHGLLAGVSEHRPNFPNSPLAQTEEPSTASLLAAARSGDPLAQTVLGEAADWLAKLYMCCGVILNPALIVVGGGLGLAAADLLMERAEREFRRNVQPNITENVRIVQSQITSSAVGAACLVWDALGYNTQEKPS